MASEYDIFERTSAGYLVWRDVVSGYENAIRKLGELGSKSRNEHFLFDLASKQVVARVNEPLNQSDLRAGTSAPSESDILSRLRPFIVRPGDKSAA